MNNMYYLIVIEIPLTILAISYCLMECISPFEMCKRWFLNKNWFGKFYSAIGVILILPTIILYYVGFVFISIVLFIYILGTKKEKK